MAKRGTDDLKKLAALQNTVVMRLLSPLHTQVFLMRYSEPAETEDGTAEDVS